MFDLDDKWLQFKCGLQNMYHNATLKLTKKCASLTDVVTIEEKTDTKSLEAKVRKDSYKKSCLFYCSALSDKWKAIKASEDTAPV